MNTVLTFLESNRRRLELERYAAGGRLTCVVVTPRFRASSHVVFLLVPVGSTEPVLVAKLPRLSGASASIEREVANLRACHALKPGGFDSIPRVVAFEEYLGRPILVETALVGPPIDPATIRRDLDRCCQAVSAWLIDLQQPRPGTKQSALDWYEGVVEEPLERLRSLVPWSGEELRLLERTQELVAPLGALELPLVFEHGDLSHPNVMSQGNGGVGVVDWELAVPQGLPTYDLFFFLTYAAFALQNARTNNEYVAAFHTAFFGRSAWAQPYIVDYAEQLRLPQLALIPLFVLCWARYMASLLMRLESSTAPQASLGTNTLEWLRTNRYYALWRHTLAHASELHWGDSPSMKRRSS
jgi:aminoglycoside phosphotransferase